MPVHVEVGNGDVIEFPDGTDESKMLEVVRKHHRSSQPQVAEAPSPADTPAPETDEPIPSFRPPGTSGAASWRIPGAPIDETREKILNNRLDIEVARAEAAEKSKKANIYDTAAKALDVEGALKGLINLPNRITGQPDYKAPLTPEQGEKILRFFNPVQSSAGSFTEGLEKGGGKLLSGATDPVFISEALLAKKFPMPVSRYWQGEMIGSIPESAKRVLDARNASELGEAAVPLAAGVLMPVGIEKHLNRPVRTGVLPSESGADKASPAPIESKPPESPAKPEAVQDAQEIITAAETRKGLPEKIAADVDAMPLEEFAAWKTEADRTGRLADKQPAYSLGEKAPDQAFVDSLKSKAEKWAAKAKELLPADLESEGATAKFNESQIAGQKAQFFREAYERATGTGSAVVGEPGYEAPFPAKPIAKFGGYEYGLPVWKYVSPETGHTSHVSEATARAKGFEPEKAPEKPVTTESTAGIEFYHGTQADFNLSDINTSKGAYFSQNREYAERPTLGGGTGKVLASNLDMKNPLIFQKGGRLPTMGSFYKLTPEKIAEYKSKGYDSLQLRHPDGTIQEAVVFDKSQIRSPTDSKGRTPERQKLLSDMATKVKEATATEGALPAKAPVAESGAGEVVIPPFAKRFNPETLLQRPAWVEPGSAFDKLLGELREKLDPHADKDVTGIWKTLTPAQKQDLAARGWVSAPTRKYGQVTLHVASDATSAKRFYAMQNRVSSKQAPTPPPESSSPSAQALGITPGGQAVIKAAGQMLKSVRNKLVNSWATRGNKSDIARTKDAADNQAKIFASQQGRAVKLEATKTFGPVTDQALRAIVPMIESGGDRAKLSHFVTQASGKHFEAMRAARFALRNFDRLKPLAAKVKALHDAQIAEENANGINTTFRENYIKHAFDVDKLPNRGEEFFGGAGGAGTKSGFKAARKFETIYDAIEAGYGDAIKSLDSAKLTESRIASGQQLINDRQWVNSFRGTTDPTTNKPLISDVTFDKNHFPIAPPGYDAVTVLPGQFVAVHNGYRGIFDAVTGGSKLAQGEVGGLPVGKALLNTAAGIKHGLLLFDTFHASRIMQKQFFLTGKVGYGKGLSLLDYNASDLAEAVHQGEITQEMADYARTNKPTAQLLLKEGLNVGRIQEALRSDIIRNLPVVGTFNKWVFDKVTRGAMMESALHEFDRTKAQDPTVPDRKVAATVAKKINVTFGNIGRQGLLRSRTMQDVSRMAMLAPQWVESMARSEIGGILELGKVPIDLAAGRGLQVGTLGKTMAGGLLAYIAGTQLLNLATRGHLTFQNEEEGHKLDAWIPDLSGKTPGYFLNPLAVVAELTHDAYRYAFKKDDAVSIAVQIARNKASPMARSVGTLWNGKDYKGEKIAGSWNKISAAGAALAPTPIPVAGFRSDQPGQAQRQITASLGVKTEPAPGPRQQLGDLHSKWMANNSDPKLRHDFERRQKEEFVLDYKPLDIALRSGDGKGAADALATLRKTHSDKAIFARMRPTDNNGIERPLFHGSHETEMKFRRTLTADQKRLYDRARDDRKAEFNKFRAIWSSRK